MKFLFSVAVVILLCLTSTNAQEKKDESLGFVGKWQITMVDDEQGSAEGDFTIEFKQDGTVHYRAVIEDDLYVDEEEAESDKPLEPEVVEAKGKFSVSSNTLKTEISWLKECTILAKSLPKKAKASKRSCELFREGGQTIFVWRVESGPVRRILEKWTKETAKKPDVK